jgi:RHS repeat-associated protein
MNGVTSTALPITTVPTESCKNRSIYGYDDLGRLKTAVEKASGGTGATLDDRTWLYDGASKLTKRIVNASTTTYGYNAANELCWVFAGTAASNTCTPTPSGATTFTHDANGNMTSDSSGLALAYNIKDQTTSYTPPGGTTTSFAYAGPNQTERTALGGTTQHNTTLGLTREGSTEWTRTPAGSLISHNVSGTRRYFLNDRLGSIVAFTDSTGGVAQTYKYEPHGLLRSSSGSVTNPFRFTRGYRTGSGFGEIYKFGARYYDPSIGRWTQQDPIDQAGDLREGNRYVYAAADPINFVDPTGLLSFKDVVDYGKKVGKKISKPASFAYHCTRHLIGQDDIVACDPIGNVLDIEDAESGRPLQTPRDGKGQSRIEWFAEFVCGRAAGCAS